MDWTANPTTAASIFKVENAPEFPGEPNAPALCRSSSSCICYTTTRRKSEKTCCESPRGRFSSRHDPPGFLDSESRRDLIDLARDGAAAHRLARRANALVLLDDGLSCEAVAKVLFLDNDTIRTWYQLYQQDGIEGLAGFGHEGGICRLMPEQQVLAAVRIRV